MADLGSSRVFGKLTVTHDLNVKGIISGDGSGVYNINANNISSGTIDYARLPISSMQVNNWDTAYSWGNHASVGYALDSTISTVGKTGSYNDLTNVPSTFTPSSHNHDASDIVSGTLSSARLPTITTNDVNFANQSLNIGSNVNFGTTKVKQSTADSVYNFEYSGLHVDPAALTDNGKVGISIATSTTDNYGYSIVANRNVGSGVPNGLSIRSHAGSASGNELLGISSSGVISGNGSGLTNLQWNNIDGKPTLNLSNWNTAYSWGNHASAGYESASNKGVANGYASLDSNGLVPSSQLPSFVDDVLEYSNSSGFPSTGEVGKLYLALDTESIYRWSGSTYVQINDSVSTADQATKLSTARVINLIGDLSGSASFDGSSNISINATVANDSHTHDSRYNTKSEITSYFSGSISKTGYNKSLWDTSYDRSLTSISGSGNGTLTLSKQDGSSYTTNLSHNHDASNITTGTLSTARIPSQIARTQSEYFENPRLGRYIYLRDYDDENVETGLKSYVRDGTWTIFPNDNTPETAEIKLNGNYVYHGGRKPTYSELGTITTSHVNFADQELNTGSTPIFQSLQVNGQLAVYGNFLNFITGTDARIEVTDGNTDSAGSEFIFWGDGISANAKLIAEVFQGRLKGIADEAEYATNAGSLDGVNSTQFLRSDTDDVMLGELDHKDNASSYSSADGSEGCKIQYNATNQSMEFNFF